MNAADLQSVEALLRVCHELATDAREQARDGGDAPLLERLSALVRLIKDELANVRTQRKEQRP